jgi:hypothetical protein
MSAFFTKAVLWRSDAMMPVLPKKIPIVLLCSYCLMVATLAHAQDQFDSGDSDNSSDSSSSGGGPGFGTGGGPNSRGPSAPPHPGPAYVSGAANPCQPFGPNGYNWLANPPGVPLPPGCVRPPAGKVVTYSKTDPRYELLPQNSQRTAPTPPRTETFSKTDPNYEILPQNSQRTAPTPPRTVTFSKTDPNYEILPQKGQRIAPAPPRTVTISKTDPNYEILPHNSQRNSPSQPTVGMYRQDSEAMKPRMPDGGSLSPPKSQIAKTTPPQIYRQDKEAMKPRFPDSSSVP